MNDDDSQPIGTPPGGGSWLWDALQRAWVPNPDPDFASVPADPEPLPQPSE